MNLLGNLRVRLTAETEDFRRGLASARQNLNTFEKDFQRFRRNTLTQIASLGAVAAVLQSSTRVANEYDKAQSQLAATAKLTGVQFGFLQSVSQQAQEQFRLSAIAANGFTIELTKLASKAGQLDKAGAGLEAFLDIGAARGLSAAETLKAVQQSILGIDEGTDKLFSKNPSVIYAEYAKQIGTTAGKLSDMQKAQALLNAAMEDGAKVRGEYQRWLQSSQGQQYLLSQGIEQTQAALGKALQPALVSILPLLATMAEGVRKGIQAVQMFGATLALIPGAMHAAKAAIADGMDAGRAEIGRWLEAWRETIAEIKQTAPVHVPVVLDVGTDSGPSSSSGGPEQEGRAVARLFFDGLKDEWEALRYSVALASISLTGTESQRLALEEEHALRMLDIEQEKLELRHKAGDLTQAELDHGLKELAVRRDIAKARRTEMEAVNRQLAKQQHLLNLAESVGALFPSKDGGPGARVGNDAALVLNDKLDLSGKLAKGVGGQLGEIVGGLAGSMILPGIGGMIGGAIGSLFGGKGSNGKPAILSELEAIEQAQRDTITALDRQTNRLLDPTSQVFNLPTNFNIPSYRPQMATGGGDVSYNISVPVQINATMDAPLDEGAVATAVERAVGKALGTARRNQGRNTNRR